MYVLYLFAEILQTLRSLPVLTMKTEFTTAQINTDSQQFSRYSTLHHMLSVSSMKHATASYSDQQHHSISPSKWITPLIITTVCLLYRAFISQIILITYVISMGWTETMI